MTYTILAPDLTRPQHRMLGAMLAKVKLPATARALDWADVQTSSTPHILSVGKAALDLWHQYGLIQVGVNRGSVFTHHDPRRRYTIMVIEHPGTLMQLSLVGHQAKENMTADLRAFKMLLEGTIPPHAREMSLCGGCLKGKGRLHRPATQWVEELDGVGLCDDHFRSRARYRVKKPRKVDPSKPEAQIAGQLEMMPGDGTRVRVPKG